MERFLGFILGFLVGLVFGLLSVIILIEYSSISSGQAYAFLFVITLISGIIGLLKPKWFMWLSDYFMSL